LILVKELAEKYYKKIDSTCHLIFITGLEKNLFWNNPRQDRELLGGRQAHFDTD
jgi:hypothetical protein